MSSTLALNCLVSGDDSDHIFTIEIANAKNVSALKDAIKGKKQPAFDHVPADTLVLWNVSFPVDEVLEENLRNFVGEKPLSPVNKLSKVFSNVDETDLHIVVGRPPVSHLSVASEPPLTLALNCLVLGEPRSRIFPVKIAGTESVGALKEAIKDKKQPAFDHVPADTLVLWNVSFPVDEVLEENLRNFVGEKPLSPVNKLSKVFSYVDETDLHIVVGRPPVSHLSVASEPPLTLALNCLVLGEPRSRIFTIEIANAKNVSALKKAIKAEKQFAFQHVDADALLLWRVSVPPRGNLDEFSVDFVEEKSLLPTEELSEVFPGSPPRNNIHVVVKSPILARLSKRTPPSAYKPPPVDDLGTLRTQFLKGYPAKPPSKGGQPKEFSTRQADPNQAIHCVRPLHASATIPVTLLHPIFGQFVDDCQNYEPMPQDNALLRELTPAMAAFYEYEKGRAQRIREIFAKYGIHLVRTKIEGTNFETDGDISHRGFRFALVEMKNESGSTVTDPFFQAILYYLEFTRKQAPDMQRSVLPCLIIIISGSQMGFAGAAWNVRPVVEVLSPMFPLNFTDSYPTFQKTVARHLGAFQKAFHALERYYHSHPSIDKPSRQVSTHRQIFPYPTHFTSLTDSTIQHLEYVSQPMDDKTLFFGKLSDGRNVCIKFTCQYSPEAHSFCASIGAAPKLLGFEMLAGGSCMVVMDQIGDEYVEFHQLLSTPMILDELRGVLCRLHQAGFVHGDIRDTNIMVPKTGERSFLFVDFDWAGKAGEARYPVNVYKGRELWRPNGVDDKNLITADHDIQMLEHMFK